MTATIGLIVGSEVPPVLDAIIHELARKTRLVYAPGYPGPLDGCLLYRSPLAGPDDVPTAQWLETDTDAESLQLGVSVAVSPRPALLRAVAEVVPGLVMPAQVFDVGHARPFAPFTRELVRRARALPDSVVVQARGGRVWWGETEVAPELEATALATCSAAVCDRESAVRALAYGTPTVVDSGTAALLGATDGTHVRVGLDIDLRREIAAELAADPVAAAQLSRAGRKLFEDSWSVPHAAQRLREALVPSVLPDERRSHDLDVLGAPADARIRSRSGMMLSGLPVRSRGAL